MNEYFYIEPKVRVKSIATAKANREKTALFIPTRIRNKIKFRKSKNFKDVFINNDEKSILKAITLNGDIKPRYTVGKKKGLEDDITKQQIIIYTVVINKGHVLLYWRADKEKEKMNVDARLQGKYSIGFGGHTSDKDRMEVTLLLESFKDLIPALFPELAMVMSTTKARISELYEELGLEPNDFKSLKLLGTFFKKFDYKKHKRDEPIPVSAVHTGICAIAEINEKTIGKKSLQLPKSEFGGAEWVKIKDLEKKFIDIEKKGGSVEEWSWILIKEFLK